MLGLLNSPISITASIFIASILGSTHCVAMCGGLVVTFAAQKRAALFYHLGRLISYSGLGALSGWLGAVFLSSHRFEYLPIFSSILIFVTLVWIGLRRIFSNTSIHFQLPKSLQHFQSVLWKKSLALNQKSIGTLFLGMLSAFLPCGWLYSFVIAAAALKHPILGAISMSFFWLGSIPALTLVPWVLRHIQRSFGWQVPRASGVFLILAGVFSLGMHLSPMISSGSGTPHSHATSQSQTPSPHNCH